MADNSPYIQEVGAGGQIRLPKEVMKALEVAPGNQIKIEIRGDLISISRHQVKDPFAALAEKKSPGLKELMEQQESRKKEAARIRKTHAGKARNTTGRPRRFLEIDCSKLHYS